MDRTERLAADARITELEMEIGRQSRRQNYFSALASECNAKFAQIKQLETRIEVLETTCAERLELIERQAVIIKKLEATCAERDLTIATLREENELLRSQRDQIERSLSWRITAPLRMITRALRKAIRSVQDVHKSVKF
jgi:hypothetical protein